MTNRRHYGSNYGTELDPVNCSFYIRMGCCRHGENCPKKHVDPSFSQAVMFQHLWIPTKDVLKSRKRKKKHFEEFFEDLMEECLKYGDISDIMVVENMGDHMIGNTFVKYTDEDMAEKCVTTLNERFYAGRKVHCKLSTVQDFVNSRCNDHIRNTCMRGQYCNFCHFMAPPKWAKQFFTSKSRRSRRSNRDYKKRVGDYRKFPVNGSRSERQACITSWNKDLERERTKKQSQINGDGTPILNSKGGLKLYRPNRK